MDLKVAQLSDIIKYAVLELEETPSELLLHGEPIDQVQAASSTEDVKKLLLRFYRFDDESDSIDIVMLHFDLGDRQPSAVLSSYLAKAFEVPNRNLIAELNES